jgi:hypothetical protein
MLPGASDHFHALATSSLRKNLSTHWRGGCVGPRAHTGIQTPDHPAYSKSLCWHCYSVSYRDYCRPQVNHVDSVWTRLETSHFIVMVFRVKDTFWSRTLVSVFNNNLYLFWYWRLQAPSKRWYLPYFADSKEHCFLEILHHHHHHLFSIPEIHQSGYKTCHKITTGSVKNESQQ